MNNRYVPIWSHVNDHRERANDDFLNDDCLIEKVMIEAKEKMKEELNNKYNADIAKECAKIHKNELLMAKK